jgi:hypothetical protein
LKNIQKKRRRKEKKIIQKDALEAKNTAFQQIIKTTLGYSPRKNNTNEVKKFEMYNIIPHGKNGSGI